VLESDILVLIRGRTGWNYLIPRSSSQFSRVMELRPGVWPSSPYSDRAINMLEIFETQTVKLPFTEIPVL
jgi:hypothetical protein